MAVDSWAEMKQLPSSRFHCLKNVGLIAYKYRSCCSLNVLIHPCQYVFYINWESQVHSDAEMKAYILKASKNNYFINTLYALWYKIWKWLPWMKILTLTGSCFSLKADKGCRAFWAFCRRSTTPGTPTPATLCWKPQTGLTCAKIELEETKIHFFGVIYNAFNFLAMRNWTGYLGFFWRGKSLRLVTE